MPFSFEAVCPYCGDVNILNLINYEDYQNEEIDLIDICDFCGNDYLFELELVFHTDTFIN